MYIIKGSLKFCFHIFKTISSDIDPLCVLFYSLHHINQDFHFSHRIRLRCLWLQGRWQCRCLLRRRPHPRLQPEPHPQDHRRGRRPDGEGKEDPLQGWCLPHVQGLQGLQGPGRLPRLRWDHEAVRQKQRRHHAGTRAVQAADQPRREAVQGGGQVSDEGALWPRGRWRFHPLQT